jgi:hypothetical protein
MSNFTQQLIAELEELSPEQKQQVLEFTKSLKSHPPSPADPLARLKQSPLIGSFDGDPKLSTECEDIARSLWQKQQ